MQSRYGHQGALAARAVAVHAGQATVHAARVPDIVRSRRHDQNVVVAGRTAKSGAPIDVPGGFDVDGLKAKLGFLRDAPTRDIVERDLAELRTALETGLSKAALLLCGSVLEAVLLDVVGRNRAVATTYRKRSSFPDEYSLTDLVDVATNEKLLSASVGKMATSIIEHRDLIHPAAELRGGVKVDPPRASTMVAFMDRGRRRPHLARGRSRAVRVRGKVTEALPISDETRQAVWGASMFVETYLAGAARQSRRIQRQKPLLCAGRRAATRRCSATSTST